MLAMSRASGCAAYHSSRIRQRESVTTAILVSTTSLALQRRVRTCDERSSSSPSALRRSDRHDWTRLSPTQELTSIGGHAMARARGQHAPSIMHLRQDLEAYSKKACDRMPASCDAGAGDGAAKSPRRTIARLLKGLRPGYKWKAFVKPRSRSPSSAVAWAPSCARWGHCRGHIERARTCFAKRIPPSESSI